MSSTCSARAPSSRLSWQGKGWFLAAARHVWSSAPPTWQLQEMVSRSPSHTCSETWPRGYFNVAVVVGKDLSSRPWTSSPPLPPGSAQCRRAWEVGARVLPAVGRLGLGHRAAGSLAVLSAGVQGCCVCRPRRDRGLEATQLRALETRGAGVRLCSPGLWWHQVGGSRELRPGVCSSFGTPSASVLWTLRVQGLGSGPCQCGS